MARMRNNPFFYTDMIRREQEREENRLYTKINKKLRTTFMLQARNRRTERDKQFRMRVPKALAKQVRSRVQREGRWPECRRLLVAMRKFLREYDARVMSLYCMPRGDGQPHEFTGLIPMRVRIITPIKTRRRT